MHLRPRGDWRIQVPARQASLRLFQLIMLNGQTYRHSEHERQIGTPANAVRAVVMILLSCSLCGCHLTGLSALSGEVNKREVKTVPKTDEAAGHKIARSQGERDSAKNEQEITPASFAVDEKGEIHLTLESAMHLALQTSNDIQVISTVPQEIQTEVSVELSQFDPRVSSGAQFGQSNQQAASTVQALGTNLSSVDTTTFGSAGNSTDQLQIEKQWQSGTTARLGYNSNYNFNNPAGQFLIVNPAWRSGLRLTLEQPLFQGARSNINQAGIRIARLRFDQSNQEFRAEVNRILHDVEVAYWKAHLTQLNVDSLQRMVKFAEQTWQHERQQQTLGISSIADESQARDNLESTRAQLATAERDQATTEQQLRQRLGIDPALTTKLQISAEPHTDAFSPDLESGIQQAVAIRPEVRAQKNQVHMTALDVERKRDSLLPDLNLLAGYGLTGLSSNYGSSMSALSSTDYGNWNVGVTFQQTLGQRDAKSRLRQSELVHTRARRAESAQIDAIQYEVRESYEMLRSAFEVLQSQNARLEAAESRFNTHRRMYETGQLNIDRLMPSQEAYVMALRDQNAALVQYNLSIHRWHYVTGQLTMDNVEPTVTTTSMLSPSKPSEAANVPSPGPGPSTLPNQKQSRPGTNTPLK